MVRVGLLLLFGGVTAVLRMGEYVTLGLGAISVINILVGALSEPLVVQQTSICYCQSILLLSRLQCH